MSGTISDNAVLELERQRVQLRTTLRNKGRTPTDNETMDNLVDEVDYLESADFINHFCNDSLTEIVSDTATYLRRSAFAHLTNVEKISLPNVVQMAEYVFYNCSSLTHLNLINLQSIIPNTGFYPFFNVAVKVLYLPNLTTHSTNAYYIFNNMPNLEKLFVGKLEQWCASPLLQSTKIKYIELKKIPSLSSQVNLETVVIRNSSVASLGGTSYIPNNTCVFYVPQDLIASYKTATNWSALPNINDRLIALEGSPYEVDGWYENTQEYRQEVLGEE